MRKAQSIENRIDLLKYLKSLGEYTGTINSLASKYAISSSFLRALNEMGIITLSYKKAVWVGTQKDLREVVMLALKRETSMREESRGMIPFQRSRDYKSSMHARKAALENMWVHQQTGKKELLTYYYRKHGVGTNFIRALQEHGYLSRDNNRSWNFIKDPTQASLQDLFETEGQIRKNKEKDTIELSKDTEEEEEKPENSEPETQVMKPPTTPNYLEDSFRFGAMVGARKSLDEITTALNGDTITVLKTARQMKDVIDTSYLMDEGRRIFDELFS